MQGLGEELNAKIEEKQLGKQTAPTWRPETYARR
jgi:hypothetical protein